MHAFVVVSWWVYARSMCLYRMYGLRDLFMLLLTLSGGTMCNYWGGATVICHVEGVDDDRC